MPSRLLARSRRRSAARHLARRMAELDRLDREYGLGAMPSATTGRTRPGPRRPGSTLTALVVAAVVLVAVVALSPGEDALAVRRLLGLDDDRLSAAPRLPDGAGPYRFLQTQAGGDEPVAYDPCRVIEVLVNPEGAPPGADQLIDDGLAHVGGATGLVFARIGLTDDREVTTGGTVRRRPVLIAWATPDEVPELAGDVAGLGGSIATGPPGMVRYVTGRVILDRDLFASFGADDVARAQAIVDHELGHLVGLDHVTDPGELMNAHAGGRTTYGPGDLEGLARLGSVEC